MQPQAVQTSQRPPLREPPERTADSSAEVSYRIELIRKGIHLCSISIPILYLFVPRLPVLQALIPATICFLIVDIGRYYLPPVERWFNALFRWLLRDREIDKKHKRLNGATYVFISATLVVLLFPKLVAVTSFVILIVGDLSAALVGKRFGRHRFFHKSLEGSAAFLVTGLVAVLVLPKIDYHPAEYLIGAVAVAFSAFVEALPIDLDDNLTIPLAAGAVMWVGYALFLPFLNINRF